MIDIIRKNFSILLTILTMLGLVVGWSVTYGQRLDKIKNIQNTLQNEISNRKTADAKIESNNNLNTTKLEQQQNRRFNRIDQNIKELTRLLIENLRKK